MSRLVQLAYYSRPSEGTTTDDVEAILQTARQRNAEKHLTGVLLFRHDLYLQVLEGDRTAVSELLGRIQGDDRHQGVVVAGMREVSARSFPNWSMGYFLWSELTRPLMMKYAGSDVPDVESMSFESLVDMVAGLADSDACSAGPVPTFT